MVAQVHQLEMSDRHLMQAITEALHQHHTVSLGDLSFSFSPELKTRGRAQFAQSVDLLSTTIRDRALGKREEIVVGPSVRSGAANVQQSPMRQVVSPKFAARNAALDQALNTKTEPKAEDIRNWANNKASKESQELELDRIPNARYYYGVLKESYDLARNDRKMSDDVLNTAYSLERGEATKDTDAKQAGARAFIADLKRQHNA